MDFLSNAIISADNSSVLGALITTFNPSDYQSRSTVKLYTSDELLDAFGEMAPRGFKFEKPGILYSDSTVMRIVTDSVFSYMEQECRELGKRTLDITDFVLRGAEKGGCVFVNFEGLKAKLTEENVIENGVMVPFKNFKVSNSSFNIYASYIEPSGGYKTISLLTVEDGSPEKFYAMFPSSVDMSDFSSNVTPCGTFTIDEVDQVVYEVELGLSGFYANVGEAFLNFLAYNVSFYNIGEKLIREMQTVMPSASSLSVEDKTTRVRRKARVNVSIQHTYKNSRLSGVMGRLNDTESLIAFINDFPEASITYQWLQKLYQSPWYMVGEGKKSEEENIYAACINLLPVCRQERLKYALELLTHRYYIYMLGIVNDTLGPVLKGGGVSGESIKRVTF